MASHRQTGFSVVFCCSLFVALLGAPGEAHCGEAETPLADAAQRKQFASMAAQLDRGAEINAAQVDGMTALHWATYYDEPSTVKLLVDRGAEVNVENRYGIPPLWLACQNGSGKIVEWLLEAGADPNTTVRGGETVLMRAARTGRLRPVEALIAAGADVDARGDDNQTALMWAAAEGHAAVVETLIEAGADFRDSLRSGFTPLFFAVREGHTNVVKVLVDAGADVNEEFKPKSGGRKNRTTALILAVENGHFETAAALLDLGADPNAVPAGFTALHAITWVRRPLQGDTDPAPIGSGKLSSLEFVSLLIDSGADINARYDERQLKSGGRYGGGSAQFTQAGSTAFMMATRNSDLRLIKLLLDKGADWRISNVDKYTPLLAAAGVGALGSGDELAGSEAEVIEAIRLLLERGADVNAVTATGETAIHGAAYQERPEVIRFLVANGADVRIWNQKNKFGWTPLMIARGHRPGNFRPSPKTIVAIEEAMRAAGVEIPPPIKREDDRERYQ